MTDDIHDDATPAGTAVPERLAYTSPPALMTAVVLSIVLLSFAMFGWYALGKEIRDQITWVQAGTLVFFMLFMIGVMLSVGYSRLWADENGVTVRNGPVLRRYPIERIAGVRLRKGDAWSSLLLKGETELKRTPVLAIQSLEGEAAQRKLIELRRWLVANGATSRDAVVGPEDEPRRWRPTSPEGSHNSALAQQGLDLRILGIEALLRRPSLGGLRGGRGRGSRRRLLRLPAGIDGCVPGCDPSSPRASGGLDRGRSPAFRKEDADRQSKDATDAEPDAPRGERGEWGALEPVDQAQDAIDREVGQSGEVQPDRDGRQPEAHHEGPDAAVPRGEACRDREDDDREGDGDDERDWHAFQSVTWRWVDRGPIVSGPWQSSVPSPSPAPVSRETTARPIRSPGRHSPGCATTRATSGPSSPSAPVGS
ncbi:hypothetical protein G7085_18030 [Tessaracoccus sp. HDW20]|nr:hypothetical protein [Tessaracoccus coleopterorum]